LIAAGVSSFKIEGRLKTAEYVANITRHYRTAIDSALAGKPVAFTPRDVEEMELSFSRGFSPGWLQGCDHKMLVPATSSAKRGVRLGTVAAVRRGRVAVDLVGSVKRGDGVAFDSGATSDEAVGGRVFEVFQAGRSLTDLAVSGQVELTFGPNAFDFAALKPGQAVWKTDDPALTSRLRKTFANGELRRQQPVDLVVSAAVGEPLRVRAQLANGVACEVVSAEVAAEAEKHPLDEATLRAQLGRLGATPFALRGLSAQITGRPMLPWSVLGKVRRELIEKVGQALACRNKVGQASACHEKVGQALACRNREPRQAEACPTLHVMVRSLDQLRAGIALGERSLYADFADIRHYREAIEIARAAGAAILPATPRIQKPDELGIFALMHKQGPDGVLARNYAGLRYFRDRGLPVVADFSLNVTNELAAEFFMEEGVGRVTASYDMNREQLLALVAATPPGWLEVVIHQHMPMFHMEHCVFCAVLSPGTNKTNCGRPCDEHVVKLRDRIGVEHLLTADVGCRNTLYNSVPQSASEAVPALLARGVGHYRVELLEESAEEIGRIVKAYRGLLAGETTGREVWTRLNAANRVGVTRGTLEERRNPLAIL
jgi:putative protease